MTFEGDSFGVAQGLGRLEDAGTVPVQGAVDLATYVPEGQGPSGARQFQLPAGDRRPVVVFFYCRVLVPGGKMCSCEVLRRMALSDMRAAPHVANYRWLELDVDDPRNADLMRRFDVQGSPVLVFCDALGNEVNRVSGAVQGGRLIELLQQGLTRNVDAMERHQRQIAQLSERTVACWQAVAAGDVKTAVREGRRLQQQANRSRYAEFEAEAQRLLAACRAVGLARVREIVAAGSPADETQRALVALRSEYSGIDEVQQAIDDAVAGLTRPSGQ